MNFVIKAVLLKLAIFTSLYGQEIIFEDGFESGNLNTDFWTAQPVAGNGIVEPVRQVTGATGIPHTGNWALAMGRTDDNGTVATNSLDLHLDLSGKKDVTLEFWIRSEADNTDGGDAILISDDGGQNFKRALGLDPSSWGNSVYGLVVVNLGMAAAFNNLALNDQFVVRFQQQGQYDFDPSFRRDGFFIDDIVVRGAPQYATLPFSDGFEADTLGPAWRRADPFNSDMPVLESEAQWGFISPVRRFSSVSGIPRTGDYALAMGRAFDSNWNGVNALDLHLDLSGEESATLEFWIRSEADDSDPEDAILISDDGGKNFSRALKLSPSLWASSVYGLVVVDLAKAAAFNNMALSDRFVVRFQQQGQYDFDPSFRRDGFFIDDIVVRGAPQYATLPFADGFEADTLGPAWRRADPFNSDMPVIESEAQWGFISPVRRLSTVSDIPHTGNYALAMGRAFDAGGNGVNALDLHLDLSAQNQAELRFFLRDEDDDSDGGDVLLFSDDGGKSFAFAFALDPRLRPNSVYSEIAIDIDSLAQVLSISLSDKFVIRFQQRGQYDFDPSFRRDGFLIDDIRVSNPSITSVETESPVIPSNFSLLQNYPNPFNPETLIQYEVPAEQRIAIDIFDILGNHVRTLVNEIQQPGIHTAVWNGTNDNGFPVSSGVYLYKMQAQKKFSKTRKMILVR